MVQGANDGVEPAVQADDLPPLQLRLAGSCLPRFDLETEPAAVRFEYPYEVSHTHGSGSQRSACVVRPAPWLHGPEHEVVLVA